MNLTQITIISTTLGNNHFKKKWSTLHSQQKSPKFSTWMHSQKLQNDFCSFPRQTIQYYNNPSLYPDQLCWINWSWMCLWRSTRPSTTNTQNGYSFHYMGLEWKSRKSRDSWVTGKFGLGIQNEAGQSLREFCQENTLVIANTLFQQHKRRCYTLPSPDGQYWHQTDYILCSQIWRSAIESAKEDWEQIVTEIMNPYGQIQTEIKESRENH